MSIISKRCVFNVCMKPIHLWYIFRCNFFIIAIISIYKEVLSYIALPYIVAQFYFLLLMQLYRSSTVLRILKKCFFWPNPAFTTFACCYGYVR